MMRHSFAVAASIAALVACSKTTESPPAAASSSPASAGDGEVKPATTCPAKAMTYLGFRGKGPPPARLVREIRER
ncbi:MAG: hypothetical protein JNL38_34720, partial [Myxococcales bacterium]|nr:hypothetical protein [Myxococcales bacterium]